MSDERQDGALAEGLKTHPGGGMTRAKCEEVIDRYTRDVANRDDYIAGHIRREMVPKMRGFLDEGRREKFMRWLGFIQGALWADGVYGIDDLKEHNRPNGRPEGGTEYGEYASYAIESLLFDTLDWPKQMRETALNEVYRRFRATHPPDEALREMKHVHVGWLCPDENCGAVTAYDSGHRCWNCGTYLLKDKAHSAYTRRGDE